MTAAPEILFELRGGVGFVRLNRPRALNALTLSLIEAFDARLRAWAGDPAVHAVVVRGAGTRAYCAGGDIRGIWEGGRTTDGPAAELFRREYLLIRRIKVFPKPYVALIGGIAMGGGVGLCVHGSHRVATERSLMALPETRIGLFPDVGSSKFLPRLPGALGPYLGLTGARLKAADALYAGLADHYVETARLPELEAALVEGLTASGVDVCRVGLGPTPMLYFAQATLPADAGLMVTGSHNPPDYNGIKLVLSGQPFFADDIRLLGERAAEGDFAEGEGVVTEKSLMNDYVARLLKDYEPAEPPPKVAWDAGNGAAGEALRLLTGGIPGTHILLNDDIDGTFPAHHPDPTVESNLDQLKEAVASEGCDLGIAFDGDADRTSAQHTVAVGLGLLIEQRPTRHGYHGCRDPVSGEKRLRRHGDGDFRSGGQ